MTPSDGQPAPIRMNWSAILASASLSLALVVGVIAWIVTHPNKAPHPSKATSLTATVPAVKTVAVPPAPVIETTLAFHRSPHREVVVSNIPLVEEDPPPLPPPAPPQRCPEPAPVQAAPHPVGETYGTQVLFLNNQAAAADLARKDHKLLFVMHISGNFEDACFT